jgi:hypothetical protein
MIVLVESEGTEEEFSEMENSDVEKLREAIAHMDEE